MSNLRLLLLATTIIVVGACGSAAPSSSPSPSGIPVTTPAAAWAAVVAFEPRFASIGPKDPNLIGQSAWYEIQPASGVGAFIASVQLGWGDCPAGCIDRHTWTLAVGPDGAITVLTDEGPVVPVELLPASAVTTGIAIRATAGPICPVEQIPPDPSCAPRPVVGARITVKDGSGATVGTGVTGVLGTLDIMLARGAYTIETAPVEGLMGTPSPAEASVADGTLTAVDLGYDTGIR